VLCLVQYQSGDGPLLRFASNIYILKGNEDNREMLKGMLCGEGSRHQLNPHYLSKGVNRTSGESLYTSMLILIQLLLQIWLQGGQSQHVLFLGMVRCVLGSQRYNLP